MSDVVIFRYVPGAGMVPSELVEPLRPLESERLRINVVFTDMAATQVALKRAVELAIDLGAATQIIVPHVVPYPLPLESPAVPVEFTRRQLRILAGSVGADPYVHVCLCRDVMDLLSRLIPTGSIVVVGARKHWFFRNRAEKLARSLQRKGYDVIVARCQTRREVAKGDLL